MEKIKKVFWQKPAFPYLELHLADHCNLNCKGCGHFAPIAEKIFPDLNQYKRDMRQLQKLFSTIHTIRLMGGEPLLNSQIEEFLLATRFAFPKTDIRVVTNGMLLSQMQGSFWNVCRYNSIGIDITIYPPMKEKETTFIQLVKDNGVEVRTNSASFFHAFYNKKGDTDPKAAFQRCRKKYYCPMFRDGKIYICSVPAMIDYFNKQFGLEVPRSGFVDVYTPNLNGWQVKEQMSKESATCCYCTIGWENVPVFTWGFSKRVLSEWDAEVAQAENAEAEGE